MAAQQVHTILAAKLRIRCFHLKRRARFVRIHVARPPIVVRAKADSRHFHARSPEDCFQLRTFAVGKKPSALRQ